MVVQIKNESDMASGDGSAPAGNEKAAEAIRRLIHGRNSEAPRGLGVLIRSARDRSTFSKWSVGLRSIIAALCVVLLALLCAVFFVQRSQSPGANQLLESVVISPSPETTTTVMGLVVDVGGAVRAPGVYRLALGSRVVDALEKAGGPADDINLDSINLAAVLSDGQRVWIPRNGEGAGGASAGMGSASAWGGLSAGLLDLNSATVEQLDALPGVGPTTAKAILDRRKELGRFRSVDDLLTVRGIGTAKLDALRGSVVVR